MLDVRLSLRAGALGFLLTALVSPLAASVAGADPNDAILAESLYAEGKQLFERSDFAAACPKLAESDRLDPAGGTVLMLAECYEGQGKIASASVAYGEAISRAKRDRRADREAEARTRLARFATKIPRFVVDVPAEVRAVEGLKVKRAGVEVPSALFDIEILADPGEYEVTAEAPGRSTFRTTLALEPGETQRVRIGPLPPLSEQRVVVPPLDPPPRSLSVAVPVSITLGVVGVASLAVGGYFGAAAIRDADIVNDRCHHAATCGDPDAIALAHTANDEANAANVLLPVGGAAIVTGLIVILVMGPFEETPRTARLGFGTAGAPGISLSGEF